ncbi:hypothetical protein [Acidomonas methanolica]|uniref:Uncharacterized protein n=1 Tax=Acidomonas methanolica NBRC 104435 TaxID=1231351 RepID=A0A023D7Q2_ACIMT|nr:hypothetical protein [Acidomonas methanolica]TCS24103.1 hypothetical protein EDC31_12524 [Acidomonas methanolica]GAJ29745.1 hypothetical protein Amme_076_038 [Acidomonas methanolica NBRC 104435]GBQ59398.1 hypothetical protein AA0498_2743 [Acidomonas methanolica]GEL00018.1 hypothetical protein AME01nite_25160 [Acidomonas methanolica NBRC 104435]
MTLPTLNTPISMANLLDVLAYITQNAPNGALMTPGITFENNQQTGLWLRPDGGLGFSANGASNFYIDENGNANISGGNVGAVTGVFSGEVTMGFFTADGNSEVNGHLTIDSEDPQILIYNSSTTSTKAAITFGNDTQSWQLGHDQPGNGTDDFYIYHGKATTTPLHIGNDDSVTMPGVVTIGASNTDGTQATLVLPPLDNGTSSKRATILLGSGGGSSDGWVFGRDNASSGANDFFFYSGTGKKVMLWMNDDGVGFNGLSPTAAPTLNAGLNQDGTATNIEMATLINQIRLALIDNGLCLG